MKIKRLTGILALAFLMMLVGCNKETGPSLGGIITLSSQLHGTETFYINGYSFEEGQMYSYSYPPEQGKVVPDIINEGYPVIEDGRELSLPGFNTPGQVNGFALVGEFPSLNDANEFFQDYTEVEEGLQFETISDTVKLYQVWVQQTSAAKYVKMVIRGIEHFEAESGDAYNELTLEYTYSPDGSTEFSCGCD